MNLKLPAQFVNVTAYPKGFEPAVGNRGQLMNEAVRRKIWNALMAAKDAGERFTPDKAKQITRAVMDEYMAFRASVPLMGFHFDRAAWPIQLKFEIEA